MGDLTKLKKAPTEAQDFEAALTTLINRHSMENGSDTPDYMLANYLMRCLGAFNAVVRARERWYKRGDDEPVNERETGECDNATEREVLLAAISDTYMAARNANDLPTAAKCLEMEVRLVEQQTMYRRG